MTAQRKRVVVAAAEDIPPGGRRCVTVGGRPIVIFNSSGAYFALFDRCPHQGAKLSQGHLTGLAQSAEPGRYTYAREGEILRCPWHGWEFDIRTGQSYCDPSRIRTRSYSVEIAPGSSVVTGPYVAETVTVTVDGAYLVIET